VYKRQIIPLAGLFAGHITSGIVSRFGDRKSRSFALEQKEANSFGGSAIRLRRQKYFRQAKAKSVTSKRSVFLWFDAGQHPVVQESVRETTEKVVKFTEAGVPLNQIIDAHDLPYETQPWGDDWWINMGRVPARFTLEGGLEGLTGPSLPEGESEEGKSATQHSSLKTKDSEIQRLRLWRNWVVSWAGIEREYNNAMRLYFVRQQRILLDKLKKVLAENGPERSTPNAKDASDEIIARIVFDLKIENGKIKLLNQTFFDKASELGIRQAISEVLDIKGDELNKLAESARLRPAIKRSLVISSHKITGINKTTQRMVADQLRSGLDAGEGLNKLTDRIKKTLGSNRARALSIARTQTAGAVGAGRHEGLAASGVELKAWLTSGDSQVRQAHVDAGDRYAEGIAVGVPFQVAGELLMYPGDPAGSAGNIINCRCVELALSLIHISEPTRPY